VWELPLGKSCVDSGLVRESIRLRTPWEDSQADPFIRHKSLGYQGVSITLRFNGFLGNARSPAAIFLELLAPTSDKTSIFLMARL